MAVDSEFTSVTHRLGCLRGIATLTGFALAVEIGDRHQFTGNSIGSFVGLVPSEHSSGTSRVQGSITRRLHARWVGFNLRRKNPVVANAAIARELAGWCWSLAVLE
jgi:transposase